MLYFFICFHFLLFLKVIRLLSRTKEKDGTYNSPLSIHHKVNVLNGNFYVKRTKLDEYTSILIEDAQVICTTLTCANDKRLNGVKFSILLIDEACHAKGEK